MSSSIFSESPVSTNESRMSDSNLVVVYGKNGVNNVDREGLQNLMNDKGVSTISVVRLTSPTPSMKDEDENDLKNKNNENNDVDNCDEEKIDDASERSYKSSDSESETSEALGDGLSKEEKHKKKLQEEKPESVGLIIEDFCLPEKTKEITKAALTLSGIRPLTISIDFEIQVKALQNDHCYTPLTSPSQLHDRKPEPKPLPTSAISAATLAKAAQKMAAIKAKNAAIRAAAAASVSEKAIEENKVKKKSIEESEGNETAEDENESDYSESEESADTDNDRDSDLDFNVNDRSGRRRKSNKKISKRKMKKILKKRQSISSELNSTQEEEKKSLLIPKVIRSGVEKTSGVLAIPQTAVTVSNVYQNTLIKYNTVQSSSKVLIPSQSPSKVQQTIIKTPQNQFVQQGSRSDVVSNIITGTGKPSGDPNGKPVVQNVVIIKPPNKKSLTNNSGGFTDITKYLTKPENMKTSNVQVCELIKPDSSGSILLRRNHQEIKKPSQATNSETSILSPSRTPRKGFMPLIPDQTKSQLPAQISVQIQQKKVSTDEPVQKEYDNQEEIDIIDSLVGQIQNSEQSKVNVNTSKTIKIFEGSNAANQNSFANQQVSQKKPLLLHPSTSHSTFTTATNQVDPVDISNAPLLETSDEIPEDLIKDMAELIDHKTLQELVEEQQQQLQNQQINQTLNVTDFETSIPKSFLIQSVQHSNVSNESQGNIIIKNQDLVAENSVEQTNLNQIDYASNNLLTNKTNENLVKESQMVSVQQPVQVVSRSGRVITLPPIEAPTTRAKRRAAAGIATTDTPTPPMSSNASEASESEFTVTPKVNQLIKQQKNSNSRRTSKDQKKTTDSNKKRNSITAQSVIDESLQSHDESSQEDEDDPNKLWCICRQPHNNRFMICCDSCEDWFHGTCVGVTKSMGKEMETKKTEWTCPNCKDGKRQQTIKQMFESLSNDVVNDSIKETIKFTQQEKKEKVQNSSNKKLNKRKSTDIALLPSVSTPLSKSMQQKISEIIGVPLPEPIVAEDILEQSIITPIQKKKIPTNKIAKTPQSLKPKPEKATTSSTKKKELPKLKDSEHESIKSNEYHEKDSEHKAPVAEAILCIVCKREQARPNSIYCSDDCIRKHAHNALAFKSTKCPTTLGSTLSPVVGGDGLEKKKKQPSSFEEALGNASIPTPKKIERVCVFERKTGRILTGNNAPTTTNLKRWLQENPTFEVVLPGSTQAQAIERNKLRPKVQTVVTSSEVQQRPVSEVLQRTVSEVQQRSVQTYRPQTIRPQSQQKHVIKIIKSISSNPSPKPENQLQEINEVVHKPVAQKTLTFHQILPSKGEKSEIRIENVENKIERSDKSKSDRSEKSEKQNKLEKSPSKAPLKKQLSREKERDKDSDREKSQSEPIRLNVKKTLKEKLLTRLAEITEENHPTLSESECEKFAFETEEEMFELFHKDTGVKYKAKYRSLVFNIKDHKNKTLFRKICEKIIEPKQLVRMTPEELASQELAQWRENENKHQLEMIKKSELDLLSCAKNYVLKTHKGEEVIEDKHTDRVNLDMTIPVEDVVTVLNNSTVSSTSEIGKTTPNRELYKSLSQENDIDSSLGSNVMKGDSILTEFNESMHEIDEEKKIEGRISKEKEKGRERHYRNKDRHREKSSKRSRSRSRSRDRKHHKTPQKDEDNRTHHFKNDDKEKRSNYDQDFIESKSKKEFSEHPDESDKNRNFIQHEHEEELHGFDEHDHKYKYKSLNKDEGEKKKTDSEFKEDNIESENNKQIELNPDHDRSNIYKSERKTVKSLDNKRRSYTHSPSLEDDDEKKKRRHHTTHHSHHHYHHRSSSLVSGSSPSLDSEESRKDSISKPKPDSKSSTPSSTTVSEVSGSLKKNVTKTNLTVNKLTANKIHKNKSINQKTKSKDLSEYSLIDKIFAESEKTIEEAANLVPPIAGKDKSSIKPADSQTPLMKSVENADNISSIEAKELRIDSSGNDSEQELPSSTVTISTPPEDPYICYATDLSTIIWTGNINMIDVATFNVIIQPISGNCTNIDKEFPTELDVVGRIGPDTVWDYIGKIKKSPNKEIVLVRLIPSPVSETNAYTALYLYLEKRKRLGVVRSTSAGIKDFYILPLHSKTEIPAILQTTSNSEFFDDDSRPDLLIGILIRIMDFGHLKRHTIANMSATSSILSETVAKIVRKPLTGISSSSALRGEKTVIQSKKNIGLGNSTDLEEDEDYKPESPHMNITGTKVFSILTAKAVDKIREMKSLKMGQQHNSDKEMYTGADADEPYSPGGSSEDDGNHITMGQTDTTASISISNTATMTASADELQRKVEELTRQIEKEKKELETLGTVTLPATTAELAPSLANISIPSNLQQILASIQKTDPIANISLTIDQDKANKSDRKTSVINLDEDEEYNPEDAFYDIENTGIDTKISKLAPTENQKPSTGNSRLANLSEAELMKMVPDNIDLTDSNSNSRISSDHQNSPPPSKKSRWDIDPPPPGLEDEYEKYE